MSLEEGPLEITLALAAGQDAQHLPVFGDRAPRDVNVLRTENLDDLLVGERLVCGLLGDDLPDLVLYRLAGNVLASLPGDRRVEEILELVDPLGRVDVLVGGDAGDGALVHADVLGHVPQDERAQVGDALVEEVALELDDRVGNLDDGALALVDAADEPDGRAQFLLDVVFRLGPARPSLPERVAVVLRDPQLREPVVVEHGDVAFAHFVDVDVGSDVLRLLRVEEPARLGLQATEQLDIRPDLGELDLQVLGDGRVLLGLDVLEVPADYL